MTTPKRDYRWIEWREGEFYFKGRTAKPAEEVFAMFCAEKSPAEWDALMGLNPGSMQEALIWAKDYPELMKSLAGLED